MLTTHISGDDVDLPEAKVFIVSWVDYCNKYGMGYALTDGSVGVHFNDSTSIVLSPDKEYVRNMHRLRKLLMPPLVTSTMSFRSKAEPCSP